MQCFEIGTPAILRWLLPGSPIDVRRCHRYPMLVRAPQPVSNLRQKKQTNLPVSHSNMPPKNEACGELPRHLCAEHILQRAARCGGVSDISEPSLQYSCRHSSRDQVSAYRMVRTVAIMCEKRGTVCLGWVAIGNDCRISRCFNPY
jgi:hypothetical protein